MALALEVMWIPVVQAVLNLCILRRQVGTALEALTTPLPGLWNLGTFVHYRLMSPQNLYLSRLR